LSDQKHFFDQGGMHMDLILWRHAEAIDAELMSNDLERHLTSRGEKQAQRMSSWLDRMLPQGTRILCSPAKRCEQTVLALGRKYKLREELSPSGDAQDVLNLSQWPYSKNPVLVVGHQPYLGQTVARLIKIESLECSVKKGAVWWLKTKIKGEEVLRTSIYCVQAPDML
jgi:phosphohistidine phosphatase